MAPASDRMSGTRPYPQLRRGHEDAAIVQGKITDEDIVNLVRRTTTRS
jgi:hypothetical protein